MIDKVRGHNTWSTMLRNGLKIPRIVSGSCLVWLLRSIQTSDPGWKSTTKVIDGEGVSERREELAEHGGPAGKW